MAPARKKGGSTLAPSRRRSGDEAASASPQFKLPAWWDGDFALDFNALERLCAVLDDVDTRYRPAALSGEMIRSGLAMGYLFDDVNALLRREVGNYVVDVDSLSEGARLLKSGSPSLLFQMLIAVASCARLVADTLADFYERELNRVFEQAGSVLRLVRGAWKQAEEERAGALLRQLLLDAGDVAPCKQGDIQVEMVACSTQPFLTRTDVVIVDYGAGLGRVGHGLSATTDFAFAKYVAVDEPLSNELRETVRGLKCATESRTRTDYLSSPTQADVVLVVNTLHHVPFKDAAHQLDVILRSIKPGGVLILHEMGELREPEKRNVPWTVDDIVKFIDVDGVRVVPRRTVTAGKKVPLAHLTVSVIEPRESFLDDLRETAALAWGYMKRRTVEQIRAFYERGDPNDVVELRYALITNANLDLNRPGQTPFAT